MATSTATTATTLPDIHRKDYLPPSPPASVNEDIPLRRASTITDSQQPTLILPLNTKSSTSTSPDGHLLPPPTNITHHRDRDRPTRRNTTGSAPRPPPPSTTGVLEQDIQLHAELIRRERHSRRARLQAQAQAEAATALNPQEWEKDHQQQQDGHLVFPPPAATTAAAAAASTAAPPPSIKHEKGEKDEMPLVGNLIGEGHVNYVLMYNMLTGIRVGVSRCQAKIRRSLTDADFTARHKFSFDVVGNELTPSAKYDFKFKDYAPWIFRYLREDYFHLDPADYLLSLTSKYILSELGSPGKSGSFFYFSRDYRFIIKTIHHAEHAYLLKILPRYYEHVKANPHTLLSRFYGLHRVKLPHGRKIHFVIMNNIFPPHRDIHETYDLKGSTIGREYPEEKAKENPRAVLKDLNWINRGKVLELGPEKRALLAEQLRRDSAFLESINVMDYSLLVGIHNMQRGNRDNVRRNTLKVFSPMIPLTPHRKKPIGHSHSYSHHMAQGSPEAVAIRRALYRQSDSNRLGDVQLPDAADPEPISALPPHPSEVQAQLSTYSAAAPSTLASNGDDNVGAMTSSYAPHPHRAMTHIGTSLSSSSASASASVSVSSSRPATSSTTPTTPTSTTATNAPPTGLTVNNNNNNNGGSYAATLSTTPTSVNTPHRPLSKSRSRGGGVAGPAGAGAGAGGVGAASTSTSAAAAASAAVQGAPAVPPSEEKKDLSEHFSDRQHFVFYQDEGGLRATDEANEDINVIYYVGVIDILTPYGVVKKLESFWKGMSADRHKISPVPPAEYAHRFLSFMKAVMRGGEGGGRFKAD